jgi:hypothetical protein
LYRRPWMQTCWWGTTLVPLTLVCCWRACSTTKRPWTVNPSLQQYISPPHTDNAAQPPHCGCVSDTRSTAHNCPQPSTTQVPSWSRLGRLKRTTFPKLTGGGHSYGGGASQGALAVLAGRLLCDTYLSARELVREVDYTLRTLSKWVNVLPAAWSPLISCHLQNPTHTPSPG